MTGSRERPVKAWQWLGVGRRNSGRGACCSWLDGCADGLTQSQCSADRRGCWARGSCQSYEHVQRRVVGSEISPTLCSDYETAVDVLMRAARARVLKAAAGACASPEPFSWYSPRYAASGMCGPKCSFFFPPENSACRAQCDYYFQCVRTDSLMLRVSSSALRA